MRKALFFVLGFSLLLLAGCGKSIVGKPLGDVPPQKTVAPVSAASSNNASTTSTAPADAEKETTPVASSPEPKTSQTTSGTCTDSDGGPDTKAKGTTTLGTESKTDECNDIFLTEYYCGNEGIEQINKKCSDSCENGACI